MAPLRVRRLERVRLHLDLTVLAKLASRLASERGTLSRRVAAQILGSQRNRFLKSEPVVVDAKVAMGWKLVGVMSMSASYWIWRHVGLVPAIVPLVVCVLVAYLVQRSSQ
jgi:hypothetical protein